MQEKKNWSMTSTEGKTFRRGTPDREWEFSINDFVYSICLCNEAFPLLFLRVLLMRDFEKKRRSFIFHKNA